LVSGRFLSTQIDILSFSFSLMKKKQKIKTKRQLQSFSRAKNPRNTAEKIVCPHPGSKLITLCPAPFRQNQPHQY